MKIIDPKSDLGFKTILVDQPDIFIDVVNSSSFAALKMTGVSFAQVSNFVLDDNQTQPVILSAAKELVARFPKAVGSIHYSLFIQLIY